MAALGNQCTVSCLFYLSSCFLIRVFHSLSLHAGMQGSLVQCYTWFDHWLPLNKDEASVFGNDIREFIDLHSLRES